MKKLLLSLVIVLSLFGCGGGGSSSTDNKPQQILAAELILGPGGKYDYQLPLPTASGDFTLAAELDTGEFFNVVKNGHFGIMTRACLECITTGLYRGHGVIMGRVLNDGYGTREMPPPTYGPYAVAETWSKGASPDSFQFLKPTTISPVLLPNRHYRIMVVSSQTQAGNMLRYKLDLLDGSSYTTVIDTQVLDDNPVMDMTRRNVVFFDASSRTSGYSYQIRFTNVTVS
jgi:hypothetical protein